MRNAWRSPALGLAMLTWAVPAHAQFIGQPVVNTSGFARPDLQRLNLQEVEENEGFIELSWSASFSALRAHDYEITYDRTRVTDSGQVQDANLIVLDNTTNAGEAEGSAQPGVTYTIRIRPRQVVLDLDTPEEGDIIRVNDRPWNLIVRVFPSDRPNDQDVSGTASWQFRVDTIAPPAPEITDVIPGERRVAAAIIPPQLEDNEDLEFFEAVYCVATSSVGFPGYEPPGPSEEGNSIEDLPCEDFETARVSEDLEVVEVREGLQNGIPVAIAVRSVDTFDNVGPLSNVQIQTPIPISDFYEWYRLQGGEEEGGFCFVATAAWGSQAHPWVVGLRAFRDRVLAASPSGAALIRGYYGASPPAAEWVRQMPHRRHAVQALLLPVVWVAAVRMAAPWLGGAVLLVLVARVLRRRFERKRRGSVRAAATGVLLLGVVTVPSSAFAQQRAEAAAQRPKPALPVGLGFEFKAGPYLPRLAQEDNANPAFGNIFGSDDPSPQFTFGSEVQLYRGFGSLGLYGSVGYANWNGRGLLPGSTPDAPLRSDDETTLNLIPLTAQVVYRFDILVDRTPVPLVPYVRGGLAYTVFWITDGAGRVSRVENGTATEDDDFVGRGGKFGLTGTVGMSLLLNFVDRRAAQNLYNTTKIRGTYLFFELQHNEVDDFGSPGFDFSDTTWNAGLFLEL